MALAPYTQDDFGAGVFRSRKTPAGSVYDAVNALVNDEGLLFKRGGSAYKSSGDFAASIRGLAYAVADAFGATIFVWTTGGIYTLDPGTTPSSISTQTTSFIPRPWARGVGIGPYFYLPNAAGDAVIAVIPLTTDELTLPPATVGYLAAVGNPARLIVTEGNKAFFSERGDPETMGANDYHELPQNAQITGADSLGDTCLLFTTQGVWAIQNMSFDAVDAYGNIQHTVSRLNDLILWGDPGISRWQGGLVVPCVDDVYLMLPDDLQPVSTAVRPLYRSYVKAGYQPGTATVHRGHYFLPILNANTLVDVLVCRLDRDAAWTRWSGHAAGSAYASQIGATTRSPRLLGVSGLRATDLTDCFDPTTSNATDADATVPDCVITTRDYPIGQQPGFVERLRARYELTDDGSGGTAAPTVAVAFSSDADAGSFSTLTTRGEQNGAAGWGVSDGSKYQWAKVGKRRERIRFRITQTGACASFVLRSLELLIRPQGKQ